MNRRVLALSLLLACICAVCFLCLQADGRNVSFCPGKSGPAAVRIRRTPYEETIRPWYCEKEDTWYYFLPSCLCGNRIWDDGGMALQMDGASAGGGFAWTDGQAYRMSLDSGEYTVKFLASSKLPAVFITTESGVMWRLLADRDFTETGLIRVFETDGSVSCSRGMSIHGRGNSTWFDFDKKPFNLRLDEKDCLLGMEYERDWCLLANAWDYSYMNNKLAFDMAKGAGFRYVPGAEYADVYFNGEYGGLYLITGKVETGRNRVNITDLEDLNRTANPGTDITQAESYDTGDIRGIRLETLPQDITGGYLVERDYRLNPDREFGRTITTSYFETTGYGSAFNIKTPEDADEAEVRYIQGVMSELEQAIRSEDGTSESGRHWLEMIDLTSWVRWYMMAEIANDRDKDITNAYYYKDTDRTDPLIYMGPVWDYDDRFGGVNEAMAPSAEVLTELRSEYAVYSGGWMQHLTRRPAFADAVRQEWSRYFRDYLEKEAPEKIDRWEKQIEKSVRMDVIRYPRGEGYMFQWPGEDGFTSDYVFEDEVNYLRSWIRRRADFLDTCWSEGE